VSDPRVVLASASPRRRELLAEICPEFSVHVSGVEEFEDPPLETLAERLAVAKARAVAERVQGASVVAADTVVMLDGRLLGKPADDDDAASMLSALSGRWHEVRTGVAVAASGRLISGTSMSRVLIHPLGKVEIVRYVASGRPMDKAGAYGIQDEDVPTVDVLDGCYCSVMGLPLWLTAHLLDRIGIQAEQPELERCGACPERYGCSAK
jgi:septum formation protein